MNPTPRVSQFRSTLRALAPRLLAAVLFCSALPSQAKDIDPKQEEPLPANCTKELQAALEKWRTSDNQTKEWFWDYLQGGKGIRESSWPKTPLREKCIIHARNNEAANRAYDEFRQLMKDTDPFAVKEPDPEKRAEELARRKNVLNSKKKSVIMNFGTANPWYLQKLTGADTTLDSLEKSARREVAEKKQTKEMTKKVEKMEKDDKGILKGAKNLQEKTKKKGERVDEGKLKKMYSGGKERPEDKKAGGGPGIPTGGKVKVAKDIPKVPGGDQNFSKKYTGGTGNQFPMKGPPAPMTDEEKKFQSRMGKVEQIQKDEKTVEKPGFFGKLWNGIKENPAITTIAVGALGAGIGAIAGGGKGALIGGLAGAGLGLGVSMVGRATEADETTKARQSQQALARNDKEFNKFGSEYKDAYDDREKAAKNQTETQSKADIAAAAKAKAEQDYLEEGKKGVKADDGKLKKFKREYEQNEKERLALQGKADKYDEERKNADGRLQDWTTKFDARVDGLLDERQTVVNDLNKNQEVRKVRADLWELDRKKQQFPEQADDIESQKAALRAKYKQRWDAGVVAGTDNAPGSVVDSGSQPSIVENPSNVLAGDPKPNREARRGAKAQAKAKAKPEPPHDPVYDAKANWIYQAPSFDITQEERGRWGGQTPTVDRSDGEKVFGARAVEVKSQPQQDPKLDIRANHLAHCARQAGNANKCTSSRWEQLKGAAFGTGACEELQGADQSYWDNCGRALSGR